jgi:hypothetical protein
MSVLREQLEGSLALGPANLPLIETVSNVLRDMLGEDFDAATFWDTLDGETDVMAVVGRLIRERVEAEAFEAASKAAADTYAARARRMAERQRAINRALGALLDATGETKVQHPLATVSRVKPRPRVVVTDEASIPTQLSRISRAPDLPAILRALEAGEAVPGADLGRSEPGLLVRVR